MFLTSILFFSPALTVLHMCVCQTTRETSFFRLPVIISDRQSEYCTYFSMMPTTVPSALLHVCWKRERKKEGEETETEGKREKLSHVKTGYRIRQIMLLVSLLLCLPAHIPDSIDYGNQTCCSLISIVCNIVASMFQAKKKRRGGFLKNQFGITQPAAAEKKHQQQRSAPNDFVSLPLPTSPPALSPNPCSSSSLVPAKHSSDITS